VLRKELYQQLSTAILFKGSILICFKFMDIKYSEVPTPVTLFYFHCAITSGRLGPPYFRGFTITLRHATLGGNPQNEWLVRYRNLYLTTHSTHDRHPSIPPPGFELNPSKRAASDQWTFFSNIINPSRELGIKFEILLTTN